MDKYLLGLIERMSDISDQKTEAGFDSSQSISWMAFIEAEKTGNKDFISQLIAFIDSEKDKKKREKAYFILGSIIEKVTDSSALNYLIKRVDKETDKYIVSSLLDKITDIEKPIGTDIQPLIDATKSNEWLIRHSAIQSLNNSSDPVAEATLIQILDSSEDPYNLTYANAVLNEIGTIKAIPHIEKHLKSKNRDVKQSAQFAIEEITIRGI